MSLTEKQKHDLKKFVKELETYRGRHTELVTVYVPQGYDLNKVINHLSEEQGTATNIKSAATRKNVISALERMIQHLRLFKKTPEHGLAVFSGNVAEREGQEDFKVWSMEPPVPINTRIYRCDKTFVLDILRDQMDVKEMFGLVVVDRRDANIAMLKGKTIVPLLKTHSQVPGKFKAGGQCHAFGTLVQSATGAISKIENCHNPMWVKSMIIDNYSIKESPITDKWVTQKQEVYKIKTKHPQLMIESSGDHSYFVLENDQILEKDARDLKVGEFLLTPEKVDVDGITQNLDSKKYYNSFVISKQGRDLLKEKRKQLGLLQKKLAERLGVAQTTISSYEIGKINAEADTLRSLCNMLDICFEEFLGKYTSGKHHQGSTIRLPQRVDEKLAQFVGYFIGDGGIETDRITFFEQDRQAALDYKTIFDNYLNIKSSYRYRKEKNYHQIRYTSRPLVRMFRGEFPEIKKTLDSEVPKKIMESPKHIVAAFIKGYFDAEGYVNKTGYIGIASNNQMVICQIQLLLLRFGIISSFIENDNSKNPYSNNPVFKLQINEKKSIQNFYKNIGFTSAKKSLILSDILTKKTNRSYARQIVYSGRRIRKIIENAGYNLQLFPRVSDFFRNGRGMSKEIFKESILSNIKDENLYGELKKIYDFPLLPVQIAKIEVSKNNTKMVDISVKDQNYIANGVITHNSAPRFARLREGAIKDHFKKVAEHMKEQFLMLEGLKGILIGGPGPTKYDFVEGGYITNELKKKIIGIRDLSYTGDFGLQELLDKSQDVLADEEVAQEKKLMGRFFDYLAKQPGKVSYGETEVMKNLQMGTVDILMLSEALDEEKIEKFEGEAKKVGSEVVIVSIETREGAQLKEIGKVAAILRFEVQ